MKFLIVALALPCAFAQTPEHWVSTWATSPQAPRALPAARPTAAAAPVAVTPASPAAARPGTIASFHDQTIRMIAHTTIAGRRVRIELSNAFGSTPLVIGAAHIALRDKESAIAPSSDRAVLFNGHPGCWIPAGATELSDAVNLDLPAESDLAVSIYIPEDTKIETMHAVGLHTTYASQGD